MKVPPAQTFLSHSGNLKEINHQQFGLCRHKLQKEKRGVGDSRQKTEELRKLETYPMSQIYELTRLESYSMSIFRQRMELNIVEFNPLYVSIVEFP